MVTRWMPPALMLVAFGCAAPRAQKMSFDEAFAGPRTAPVAVRPASVSAAAPPPALRRVVRGTPIESAELQAELARFADRSRKQRASAVRGGGMPRAQQENWRRVLDAVDRFLRRPVATTAPSDVIRARVALEAEIDFDTQTWGAFPKELGERALDRVTRLAVVMAEWRRMKLEPVRRTVRYEWPIDPVVVTSLFGRRHHPITGEVRAHYGVDLDAYSGQLVTAAAAGVVLRAGWNGAHGRQVEIRHPDGSLTRYSHLSAVVVEPGNQVAQGDPIGLAGSTGLSTGSHLHFELWRGGKPVDPLEQLAGESSRPAVAGTPRS